MKKVNLKKEMIHYEGSTQLTHLSENFHQAPLETQTGLQKLLKALQN